MSDQSGLGLHRLLDALRVLHSASLHDDHLRQHLPGRARAHPQETVPANAENQVGEGRSGGLSSRRRGRRFAAAERTEYTTGSGRVLSGDEQRQRYGDGGHG